MVEGAPVDMDAGPRPILRTAYQPGPHGVQVNTPHLFVASNPYFCRWAGRDPRFVGSGTSRRELRGLADLHRFALIWFGYRSEEGWARICS
jgi:hypothetical protein